MILNIMLLGQRRKGPVDEVADGRVDANSAEEGRRHFCLLDLVRCCRNEFHFIVLVEEVLLGYLANHHCVKIRPHRDCCRKGCDNEGGGDQEPRHTSKSDSTEHVQNQHNRKSKDQLDDKCSPQSERRIKPKLNRQENRIEQSRWTQIFNETHLQVLQVIKKKMDAITMVQQMTGCTRDEAEKALIAHESVIDAIAALIPENPVVSGNKYIPAKPKVETGMDAEQTALCARGRWLQDKVNAVFSVAHSKTPPDQSAEQSSSQSVEAIVSLPLAPVVEESVSSQDSLAQTAQPSLQSEQPQ